MGNLELIVIFLIWCIQEKHMSMGKSFNFRNGSDPDYQLYKRISRDNHGHNCSPVITLSFDVEACPVQSSVLGIYKVESYKAKQWPTWKMADNRFLFRRSGGMGKDWLFGNSRGSNVGWIKHRNCNGCPESCSQNWLYWDDNVKQWYLDTRIYVTSNELSSNYNNLFLLIVIMIIPLVGAIAAALCSWFYNYDVETDSDGQSDGKQWEK